MSTHWGEIPCPVDTDSGIAALEREQMTKMRSMEVEGPPLHQPSAEESTGPSVMHPAEAFAIDSLTIHTIKLVQYARKVRQLILSVQQQLEMAKTSEGEEMPTFSEAPPIPEYVGRDRKPRVQKPLPYQPKDLDSPFVTGCGSAPPEVDARNCRKLLRRSVGAICAHTGYDNCGEGLLESLTDVCHEYYTQMTQLLRRAVDNEAMHGGTGFADPLEQVFHEMGIGSPRVLHEFYETRILNYHDNMMRTCQQLVDEYERVRNPELKRVEDVKPVIKGSRENSMSDIQFPTLEEEDGETEQVIHLEGLGLDINIVNEPSSSLNTEDDSKWGHGSSNVSKSDLDKSGLDAYDQADTPAPGDVPRCGSEAGDSLQDPASVSTSDIMSPPSIGIRAPSKPPTKKKKVN